MPELGQIADFVEVKLNDNMGGKGFLRFSLANADGISVQSPSIDVFFQRFFFSWRNRLTNGFRDELMQFQLWHVSKIQLSVEEKESLSKKFISFRSAALKKMHTEGLN